MLELSVPLFSEASRSLYTDYINGVKGSLRTVGNFDQTFRAADRPGFETK